MLSPTSTDIQDFIGITRRKVARPVLVSRLSSKELKIFLLRHKGRAFDLKKMIICTDNNPNFERRPFQELGIDHILEEVPHLISIGTERLNGTEFFQERKYEEYTFEELEKAAETNVPPHILEKTIGLIRLLYTTTLIDAALEGAAPTLSPVENPRLPKPRQTRPTY